MKCINCDVEVSSSFKHAIASNICPACGKELCDEEMLALIDMMIDTFMTEATLREETARKLAVAVISQYNVSIPDGPRAKLRQSISIREPEETEEHIKVAPPTTAQVAFKKKAKQSEGIITAEQIEESISSTERKKMMEEAVKDKYNMVDGVQASSGFIGEPAPTTGDDIFTEGNNPLLEQERQARLIKQQHAMTTGGGSFRRSG